VAADIETVNFDLAGCLLAVNASGHGFAKLVGQHVGRFVLAIEITAQLQGAMTLRTVDEDSDCQEVIADRHLATGEDRPGRDRELVRATLAPEKLAGFVSVAIEATAPGTDRLALRVRPTDKLERLPCFLFRHARDGR
jgi:hypothetical protein